MANILIIDDDEILLAALAQLLQTEGHNVTVTADGPHGIEMLQENPIDLVLLDLGLPTMSGMEVLRKLKRAHENIRVIMMSGYVSPQDAQEAKDVGAFAFLDKTADFKNLFQSIASAVSNGSGVTGNLQDRGGRSGHSEPQPATIDNPSSGAQLSVGNIGVGTWSWGEIGWGYGVTHTEQDIKEVFKTCADLGAGFFDTAESYGNGESERILGRRIQSFEGKVRIATKFSARRWEIRRKDVVDACRASLGRLGLKEVELYQIHWPTRLASVEQRMDALAEIVERGMARNVGVSNYSLDQIRRAQDRLARRNLKLASVQLEYNVLRPRPETNGILRHCLDSGILFLAYSPLAMGMLSGKYSETNPPSGARSLRYHAAILTQLREVIDQLFRIGRNHNAKTASQVALNWVMCKGAFPIAGIKNRSQAEENLGAAGWRLTQEEIKELDSIDRSWLN